MRVRVHHGIGDLAGDLGNIAASAGSRLPKVVSKNVKEGTRIARRLARANAGPHGTAYYKRISGEMTSPLIGEYGPHGGGTPVGAGYRNSAPNMDMPNSADIVGPKLAEDAGDAIGRLFRENGF